MNEQASENDLLTAYLLGALPEADAEQFDELSFTDDRFADQLMAAENELIDAYIRGGLSGARLDQFTNYYLSSPVRREKVRFAEALQNFAEKRAAGIAANENEISAAKQEEPKGKFTAFLAGLKIFTAPRAVFPLGLAAAILIFAVFGGWLFYKNSQISSDSGEMQARRGANQTGAADNARKNENSDGKALTNNLENNNSDNSEFAENSAPPEESAAPRNAERKKTEISKPALKNEREEKPAPQNRREGAPKAPISRTPAIASILLAPQLRRSSSLPTLGVSEKTESVEISLELEPNDYAAYSVALQEPAGARVLWRSGKLTSTKNSGGNKLITIKFPAALLSSQIYTLQVSGTTPNGASEIISDYPFRVVR